MDIRNLILLHSSYVNSSTSEIFCVQLIKQHSFPSGTDKNCVFFLTLSLSLCNFQIFFIVFSTHSLENPEPLCPSLFNYPLLSWLFGGLDKAGEIYLVRTEMLVNRKKKKVVYKLKVMPFLSEKRNSNELLELNTQNISYTKHVMR